MASRTFEEAVAKMRSLQKEYFRTRNALTLTAAKKAEREVNDALGGMFPTVAPTKKDENYPKLFPL